MTTSVDTLRIRETESPTWASTTSILHLSIPSSQAKGKLGNNTKVLQGTKGCRLKHKFWQQWTIVSLLSILSCLHCIQRVPYIAFQRGNERSNPSDLKAYGRPGVKWVESMSRKTPKWFGFCTHSMYVVLGVKPVYIRDKGFKSCIYQFSHVFRDGLGNIKGKKMVQGV